ncbi:hypothetical protein LSUE1_G008407 [Lachnellula suecica]|uniref:Uncharacterized protein n=1 Tax=Lachnellula suecica TaxID=602035 RepID=A0A8T9BWM4_9HELO|nr:hypothetical protein LSUE1_G008407 [Lachnellula suecica]
MLRQIALLVYPARASKLNGVRAHWALFVPSSSAETKGTLIQVLGTPFTGYGLEFKRGYDLESVREKFQKHVLGDIEERWVADADGNGVDIQPRDEVEKWAKRIEVPGVHKEPLNPSSGRRCQEWTRDLVEVLVKRGILLESSVQVLDYAKSLEGVGA